MKVGLIGAGVVGLACALHLVEDGHDVTVLDRAPTDDKCSWGNAGGIAVTEVAPAAMPGALWRVPGWLMHPLGPLSVRAGHALSMVPWFRGFMRAAQHQQAERIAGALGPLLARVYEDLQPMLDMIVLPGDLHPAGALTVYESRRALLQDAGEWDLKRRHGIECREVSGDEARSLEPALSGSIAVGVFNPAWSHVSDPKRIWAALLSEVQERGVSVRSGDVTAIGGPGEVKLADGDAKYDRIVVAGGAWSAQLAAGIGDRVLLESERGYHMTIAKPGVSVSREVIFGERKFVATPLSIGLRVAGTAEFAGLTAAANYKRATILGDLARRYLPGLSTAGGQEWMGQRPTTPDSLPVIGRSPRRPDVMYAFGHGHLGLTLAATTGRIVADLVDGRDPGMDMAPFSIGRFGRA